MGPTEDSTAKKPRDTRLVVRVSLLALGVVALVAACADKLDAEGRCAELCAAAVDAGCHERPDCAPSCARFVNASAEQGGKCKENASAFLDCCMSGKQLYPGLVKACADAKRRDGTLPDLDAFHGSTCGGCSVVANVCDPPKDSPSSSSGGSSASSSSGTSASSSSGTSGSSSSGSTGGPVTCTGGGAFQGTYGLPCSPTTAYASCFHIGNDFYAAGCSDSCQWVGNQCTIPLKDQQQGCSPTCGGPGGGCGIICPVPPP